MITRQRHSLQEGVVSFNSLASRISTNSILYDKSVSSLLSAVSTPTQEPVLVARVILEPR